MDISSFFSNKELTDIIMTIAVQSIIVSILGITVIKLLSKKSAPVRSLVCTVAITVLGLVLLISTGLRLSGISWSQPNLPAFFEKIAMEKTSSNNPSLVLPIERFSYIDPLQQHSSIENPAINTDPSPSPLSIKIAALFIPVINFLGFIWFMGMLFQLIRLGYGIAQVKRFKRSLKSVPDEFYNNMIRTVAGAFWKNRIPELHRSSDIESPVTIGLFNPIIIIPEKLSATLRENELKSILLHELAHIYHLDQVMGLLKRILLALHWWNPLVYAINREHEQAREEVSDNYVLREINPRVYTRCLANLAEKVCLIGNLPTAAGIAGRYFNLPTRVELILSKKRNFTMRTKIYLKIITFTIGLVLSFGVAGLHCKVNSKTTGDELDLVSTVNSVPLIEGRQKHSQVTIVEKNHVDAEIISNVKEALHIVSPDKSKIQVTPPATALANTRTQTKINQEKKAAPKSTLKLREKVLNNNNNNIIVLAKLDRIEETSSSPKNVPKQTESKSIQALNDTLRLGMNNKQHSVKEQNDDIVDYFSRGNTYLKKGKIEKAISDFNRAIELNENDARLYLYRGKAYTVINRYQQAINDYSKAIELDPEYAMAYNNRGFLFFIRKEYERAIDDFTKAIKIDPEYFYAYYNRGNAYSMKREYSKAISNYKKAIKINPQFLLAYINRGYIYYQKRSFSKAIKDFSKALELNNKDTRSYLLRGNAYRKKGKYKEAINDYTKIIKISPEFAAAYFNRGQVNRKIKEYDKAISDYSKVIELNPDSIYAYTNRGDTYYIKKRYDKAISDYSKAIDASPDFAYAYTKRGKAYHITGQLEKEKEDKILAAKLTRKQNTIIIDIPSMPASIDSGSGQVIYNEYQQNMRQQWFFENWQNATGTELIGAAGHVQF